MHLLAEDLTLLETTLANAEWRVARLPDGTRYVAAAHGVSFLVRQASAEAWLEARTALTGERLELHRAAPL